MSESKHAFTLLEVVLSISLVALLIVMMSAIWKQSTSFYETMLFRQEFMDQASQLQYVLEEECKTSTELTSFNEHNFELTLDGTMQQVSILCLQKKFDVRKTFFILAPPSKNRNDRLPVTMVKSNYHTAQTVRQSIATEVGVYVNRLSMSKVNDKSYYVTLQMTYRGESYEHSFYLRTL